MAPNVRSPTEDQDLAPSNQQLAQDSYLTHFDSGSDGEAEIESYGQSASDNTNRMSVEFYGVLPHRENTMTGAGEQGGDLPGVRDNRFGDEEPLGYESSDESGSISLMEALAAGSSWAANAQETFETPTEESRAKYRRSPPSRSRHRGAGGDEGSSSAEAASGSATTPGLARVLDSPAHSSTSSSRSRYYPYPSSSSRQIPRAGLLLRHRSTSGEHARNDGISRRSLLAPTLTSRRGSSFVSGPDSPQSSRHQEPSPAHTEVVIPRWQPDAEVTYCPICHSQFTWVNRKHHCRKCGRVVCNACSPHRITIPHRYIVQPPTAAPHPGARSSRDRSGSFNEGSGSESLDIGGGSRVRLCNPCVPDPNVAPPQINQTGDQGYQPSFHNRSASLAGSHSSSTSRRDQRNISDFLDSYPRRSRQDAFRVYRNSSTQQYLGGSSTSLDSRSRSSTHAGTTRPPQSDDLRFNSTTGSSRPMDPQRPFLIHPNSNPQPHYRSMVDDSRPLPLPHPPRIAEEDECPVCHGELPSSALPNAEDLRAEHISTCISRSLNGGFSSVPNPQVGPSSLTPLPPSSSNNTYDSFQQAQNQQQQAGPSSHPLQRSGLFPYKATEKDCIDEAECTICLENYEVSVDMGRLECFCRFHLRCIREWFEQHPGRCPVHQHDGYGY